jgi:hypothetical protein
VLILAIGFVLMVSAIAAALAALILSSTATGATLEKLRNRQYAADAAIQYAITQVRDTARAESSPCGSTGYVSTLNQVDIRVDCANAIGVVGGTDNAVLSQRNVIFVACLDVGQACTDTSTIIRAQVNFEQRYDSSVTQTFVQSWSVNR